MPQTTILFKIDKDLKKHAQATAKELGIPLSLVLKTELKRFVHDKSIEIEKPLKLNARAEKRIARILKDVREDKNMSSPISVDEFLARLKK